MHDRAHGTIRIRCSRSIESCVCQNNRRYNLNKIEAAVISGLKTQLMHPELLAEYVRVYREERRAEAAKAARERVTNERRLAELNRQVERLIQALARGMLPIEEVEAQYKTLESERDRIAAELAEIPTSSAIELHPHAPAQYRNAVENLAGRLNELDARVDAEAIVAFRNLVDSVVVHDRPDGGVEVEVIGHLSALIGANAEILGGRVVAEEGFEPPTQGL